MEEQLIAALVGLLVGAAGAWVKAVLAIRQKVNEDLRSLRLNTYPVVYRLTGQLSFWPPAKLTYEDLFKLNLAFRDWYFSCGGLYLSANGRERYGDMKKLLCAHLDELDAEADRVAAEVPSKVHDDLADTTRAFRDALTEDLETRRQRSLWWVVSRWRRHRRQHREWKQRMDRAGGTDREFRAYPLEEMPLGRGCQEPAAPTRDGGPEASAQVVGSPPR